MPRACLNGVSEAATQPYNREGEEISHNLPHQIVVTKDGPYVVTGAVPLAVQTIEANGAGKSWEWAEGRIFEAKDQYALCRCGRSGQAPYCDGTHARVGFDGTETATHEPFDAQKSVVEGPTVTLDDARSLCAAGRFCDAVLTPGTRPRDRPARAAQPGDPPGDTLPVGKARRP